MLSPGDLGGHSYGNCQPNPPPPFSSGQVHCGKPVRALGMARQMLVSWAALEKLWHLIYRSMIFLLRKKLRAIFLFVLFLLLFFHLLALCGAGSRINGVYHTKLWLIFFFEWLDFVGLLRAQSLSTQMLVLWGIPSESWGIGCKTTSFFLLWSWDLWVSFWSDGTVLGAWSLVRGCPISPCQPW